MTIQSIDFSNIDLAYVINYEDGSDVKMLGSNDPALDSLTEAHEKITLSLRNYTEVSENFSISTQKVTWGKDAVTIKYSLLKKEGWPKRKINCLTKVVYARKKETDIETERLMVLEDAENLQKEVEKYLMGQRMQKELPFQE